MIDGDVERRARLLDDLRRERALLLGDNRGLSNSEIAIKLRCTELPNFTRAFRKWTGVTPIAYRECGRQSGTTTKCRKRTKAGKHETRT